MIATFKVQDPIEQPESNNPAYAVKSDDGKTNQISPVPVKTKKTTSYNQRLSNTVEGRKTKKKPGPKKNQPNRLP